MFIRAYLCSAAGEENRVSPCSSVANKPALCVFGTDFFACGATRMTMNKHVIELRIRETPK